ncbi:hypothetical protein O3G_MSEX013157 [Manduca sexta]|uniref:Beta-N-acetylhexosaminidase n=1 Tax=Manduca sexta TaxID=7130 RepID=A0A922CY28_MANSE|nr:hypothetical protein O3G_MSEX013157 [Manduca sexta]
MIEGEFMLYRAQIPVSGQINKCVSPPMKATQLNARNLVDIIDRYKNDICADDVDKAILCTDDIEPFIKYKYPILRLRYLCEIEDLPKKLYIMTTVLLFHCCCNSRTGEVDADICDQMDEVEQEIILKFCERLSDMEVTVNNVERAVTDAFELVANIKALPPSQPEKMPESDSLDSLISESPINISYTDNLPTDIKFKSSVTVLPSAVTDTSTYSDVAEHHTKYIEREGEKEMFDGQDLNIFKVEKDDELEKDSSEIKPRCQPDCDCTRCSAEGPCCGDPGSSMKECDQPAPEDVKVVQFEFNWVMYSIIVGVVMMLILVIVLSTATFFTEDVKTIDIERLVVEARIYLPNAWQCVNSLCQKMYQPIYVDNVYTSHSRCVLICMGPQLWPYPIGYTYFSKQIAALATNKLEYKFQSVPSETVHQYLAEAFKLFIAELAKLERIATSTNETKDLVVRKMNIQIDVEADQDPRLRLNTEEAYSLKIELVKNQVMIKVSSASFCGVRHGLETLTQLILLDQTTGYLITLTKVVIKDAPSYKYRGLMIDTGRNYIPVNDLMRTIDGMSSCKLNTFHWRISDVTSFPLYLPKLPQLFEYGGYDRSKVYTKDDVKTLVKRAKIRGIRVVIEVAAPGPVGRPWSWSSDVSCPIKNKDNFTCDNHLCLRMKMKDSLLDVLQIIYSEILEMTNIDDVFHLSDGIFSLSNCYLLIEEREGFLDKALDRLKIANKGFLPTLPVIWFTTHLTRDFEAKTWERLGVQLNEWQPSSDQYLGKFKVIHSSKWDLSCEMKKQRCRRYRTWQEMYGWKSWRNIEVFTIEGGETILWTDLVDTSNLDNHLWPRAAAVAERLWSDIVINSSASGPVYVRLDHQRWRMLLRGVKVQPVWPVWCSFNPGSCLSKLR